jgi:hypothetical protein
VVLQTAGLAFGGFTTANTNATEEYDGSAWTAGGNLGTARSELAGAGIQTAGLKFGGNIPPYSNATEEYDGFLDSRRKFRNSKSRISSGRYSNCRFSFGGEAHLL